MSARLRVACAAVATSAGSGLPLIAARRRNSARPSASSGYDFMGRETRADAGRRHRQSRHALGARRRGAVERARPARPTSPAPTATATRAASMKGVAARYPAFNAARAASGRSRAAHQHLPRGAAEGDAAAVREQGAAGADGLCRAAVARHADRRRGRRARCAVPRRPAATTVQRAPGPAQFLLRAMPRRQLGAKARRRADPARRIRPAIRSTAWNGRRSARCSGGCATASSACAPSLIAYGAPEYVELELYLMWRARGMAIETPAVRP